MKGKTGQDPAPKPWVCAQCGAIVNVPAVKAHIKPRYGRTTEILHICR